MKRSGKRVLSACAAAALSAGSALATDGTWVSIGGGGGNDYGRTNNWLNGVVAGGAGATLTSYSGVSLTLPVPPAAGVATNVTLGSLVVPADASTAATLTVDPGFGTYGHTAALVLDSGAPGVPAALLNACVTNTQRIKVRSDIRLQSDLLIAYNPTNWIKSPHTAVYLTGSIAEDGTRRGLVISNGTPQNQVSLFGNNTFSGDIEVRQGGLRAQAYTRLGGVGRQFGRDNTIIVTNANAQLDLGGFSFGADQRLVVAGCGVGGLGALAASQQSPCHTSVWSGPITLAGDAAVGMGYCSYYPRKVGGGIALTGPIGEQGAGRVLIKNSPNTLFLRGTNTYSGGTIISNGYLSATCRENLGAGALTFGGGALLFDTPWDITSSGVVMTNANNNYLRLRLEGPDVTFNGVLGPCGSYYKSGRGTLTLTRACKTANTFLCGGALNLDYTVYPEAKLPSAWFVSLYNDAALNIIGGAAPFTNTIHSLPVSAGTAAKISLRGAAGTRFNLEGTGSVSFGGGATLDLSAQSGTVLDMPRASYDSSGIMLSSRMTYGGGSAFATKVAWNDGTVIPFAAASTNWDNVTPRHMDVTALTPATVPADARIRTLRFNDPSAGQLTLSGDTWLTNGAILVTAQMGATPVHIQGGTLTSSAVAGNELVVHQYNTQAVLRISAVLTNTTAGAALVLTKTGPGTLVLSDVPNTFSGSIYVLGGTLEIESQQAFGATNRLVYVYNGSTLRLRNGMVIGAYNQQGIQCNEAGGKIDVPAGETATSLARVGMQSHGLLTKTGKGVLRYVGDWTQQANEQFLAIQTWNYTVEEGTLDIGDNLTVGPRGLSGECQVKVTVKNGAVLRGAGFLFGNGATNGGGNSEDEQGSYHLFVDETGGVVDLHGVSVNLGRQGNETYSCDFISGPGRLTITNSSVTAATFRLNGAHLSRFTGVLDGARYYLRTDPGGGVPCGEISVPSDVAVDFGWVSFPNTLAIGRLTGSGAFGGKSPDNHMQPPLLVGRDADETFEFSGYLWGTYNSIGNSAFPFRYTKVGSNAWRISGTTNAMTGDVTVRSGTILVGADSPGQGAVGALGKARVPVGDEETGASCAALLTDGPYTVGNALALTNTAGTLTLGGNQTAGASLFTSALDLPRDVILTAANTDAAGVTFSGAISGLGGITKTGVGAVYLTGPVSNAGPTTVLAGRLVVPDGTAVTNTLTVAAGTSGGGTLAVNGNLTLGVNSALALSVAGALDRAQTYTLVTWSGTRTGVFASVTGLPEKWHAGYRANSVVIFYAENGMLIRVL